MSSNGSITLSTANSAINLYLTIRGILDCIFIIPFLIYLGYLIHILRIGKKDDFNYREKINQDSFQKKYFSLICITLYFFFKLVFEFFYTNSKLDILFLFYHSVNLAILILLQMVINVQVRRLIILKKNYHLYFWIGMITFFAVKFTLELCFGLVIYLYYIVNLLGIYQVRFNICRFSIFDLYCLFI